MISVYGDGSSHARGGKPGGWGFVVVRRKDLAGKSTVFAVDSGGDPFTSNNIMEMTALIKGLQCLARLRAQGVIDREEKVEVVSDSQYALGMASGAYSASKNLEVVAELRQAVLAVHVDSFRWVRGHEGEKWNERCDGLAAIGKAKAVEALKNMVIATQKATGRA